ncbi:MAG: ABC transporter permease subunit [Anaerolineae bacterium]|nr:ABC transporter permease subunit [Anaerolineae bacterium]
MQQTTGNSDLFYVAPQEAPPARRPPALSVGALGWLRDNLFSSPTNSILTIVMAIAIVWAGGSFLTWAFRDAEWSVITTNLRLMMVGQYNPSEIWRVNLVALVTLFLCGASVALAAGVGRPVLVTLAVVIILLLIIPASASQVAPPPIRYLVTPALESNPMLFTGEAGQTVTVAVEPLDDNAAAAAGFSGYLENTAGLQNSRNAWNDIRAQINAETLDLSEYDLALTVTLVDAEGTALAEATSTPGARAVTFDATLPADGWYALLTTVPDDPTAGAAFVRLDGVHTFTTDTGSVAERVGRYGPIPSALCPTSGDCRQVAERDLRYEGARDLGTYFATQLAPFLEAIIVPVLTGIAVIIAGAALGSFARRSPTFRKQLLRALMVAWVVTLIGSWFVLRGFEGSDLLPVVPTSVWGGLLLTMVLTIVSILFSFPLGVLLALGRTSDLPILSAVCTIFIEVIRGVPFITILFFAKLIVPFFISATADIDQAIRMMVGMTIFTAAYLAEVVRGGLQIVPKGQVEASKALGLNPIQQTNLIVLPQALRAVIPAIMNQFVALFKDTSLVAIVGLFELLGIVDFIVNGQQQFRGLTREAYLFVGIIYFIISYAMSLASQWVERTGAGTASR